MTNDDIRQMRRECYSNSEILWAVVSAGFEYPDAVWKVSKALRMDAEEREEMERNYDECC